MINPKSKIQNPKSIEAEAQRRNQALIDRVKQEAVLAPEVERAFRKVLRHYFLPDLSWDEVYTDEAYVTRTHPEYGWAISSSSQPTAMAMMLGQLKLQPGMKVLEIGTGTGYNAAILSELTGDPRLVWTLDLEEEICAEARWHLGTAGYPEVNVICADGWRGYLQAAPYDRIIVTASAYDIAPAWLEQLSEGGLLVMPWSLLNLQQRGSGFRKEQGRFALDSLTCVGFMPLRGDFGRLLHYVDAEGNHWRSDRLTPEEIERLNSLMQGPEWEVPFLALETPLTADEEIGGLQFFVAVQEPRMISRFRPISERVVEGGYGLAEVDDPAICFLEMGSPARIRGWGSRHLASALEQLIMRWLALGKPGSDRLRMQVYPLNTAPPVQPGEYLLRRRWFEYIIAWS